MDAVSKLQDPRVTARWHNVWLGVALSLFVAAATFAGLFGWAFTHWHRDEENCHEYYASLVHLPSSIEYAPQTPFVHSAGRIHVLEGATYDTSTCEGKLADQMVKAGSVLAAPRGGRRRLHGSSTAALPSEGFAISLPSSTYKHTMCSAIYNNGITTIFKAVPREKELGQYLLCAPLPGWRLECPINWKDQSDNATAIRFACSERVLAHVNANISWSTSPCTLAHGEVDRWTYATSGIAYGGLLYCTTAQQMVSVKCVSGKWTKTGDGGFSCREVLHGAEGIITAIDTKTAASGGGDDPVVCGS